MYKGVAACFSGALLLLSSVGMAQNYGVFEDHPYEFVVKKSVSKFSEKYIFSAPTEKTGQTYPTTYPGVVKKSSFRVRTSYDLSNQNGWQATGITRLLSFGALYSWATDIDIYDTRNVKIGFIDGVVATLESAKYSLYSYDEAGNAKEVAVVLANSDFSHFSISTPGNYLPIGDLNRNLGQDTWTVTVATPGVVDDRIIRIFAGFVMNYQDKFLAPSDELAS